MAGSHDLALPGRGPDRLLPRLHANELVLRDAYELVTVVLTDVGDGRTEKHFEQRGSMSPEQYDRAAQGWGGFFDRMDERLAAS